MPSITLIATEKCWAMSLYAVTDFFRIVQLLEQHLGLEASFQVHIASPCGQPVRCAGGQLIANEGSPSLLPAQDLLVFPALEGSVLAVPATANFSASELAWIAAHRQSDRDLLTLSTGAATLAASGSADGLRINTHWAFLPTLQQRYPNCRFMARDRFFRDQNLYSTGSMNGVFDALLDWLAGQRGDHFAQLCASHLLVSSPARQRPFLPGVRHHDDEQVLAVQEWLEIHHDQAQPLDALASRFGFSERNLKRRFQLATGIAPNHYLQRVRIDKAKKLLIATPLPVQDIGHQVGYENISHFIRLFRRETGTTPARWRQPLSLSDGEGSVDGRDYP